MPNKASKNYLCNSKTSIWPKRDLAPRKPIRMGFSEEGFRHYLNLCQTLLFVLLYNFLLTFTDTNYMPVFSSILRNLY